MAYGQSEIYPEYRPLGVVQGLWGLSFSLAIKYQYKAEFIVWVINLEHECIERKKYVWTWWNESGGIQPLMRGVDAFAISDGIILADHYKPIHTSGAH